MTCKCDWIPPCCPQLLLSPLHTLPHTEKVIQRGQLCNKLELMTTKYIGGILLLTVMSEIASYEKQNK